MPPHDCNRLCTTEARDSGCKTMRVLQPPFVSPVVAGAWESQCCSLPPPPRLPVLSPPCSQVHRAGGDCLSEGLTLGEPTETTAPTPHASISLSSFWISLNKRESCCGSRDQPFFLPWGPWNARGQCGSVDTLDVLDDLQSFFRL